MVPGDAAVDHGDRLAEAEEAVVVASLRDAGELMRGGKGLLDVAEERIEIALQIRVVPEIGRRRGVLLDGRLGERMLLELTSSPPSGSAENICRSSSDSSFVVRTTPPTRTLGTHALNTPAAHAARWRVTQLLATQSQPEDSSGKSMREVVRLDP